MKISGNIMSSKKLFLIIFPVIFIFFAGPLAAQQDPPIPITVSVVENLSFGAFYQGSGGGSVTIDPAGTRTSGGDVVLLGMSIIFTAAHYTIVGNAGTVISLSFNPINSLTGPGTMSLTLDSSNPVSPFPLMNHKPLLNHLYIGGTLTVGTPLSNPPGAYSGTFDITFNQE